MIPVLDQFVSAVDGKGADLTGSILVPFPYLKGAAKTIPNTYIVTWTDDAGRRIPRAACLSASFASCVDSRGGAWLNARFDYGANPLDPRRLEPLSYLRDPFCHRGVTRGAGAARHIERHAGCAAEFRRDSSNGYPWPDATSKRSAMPG